jgi:small-conductance mechanosensitive channel
MAEYTSEYTRRRRRKKKKEEERRRKKKKRRRKKKKKKEEERRRKKKKKEEERRRRKKSTHTPINSNPTLSRQNLLYTSGVKPAILVQYLIGFLLLTVVLTKDVVSTYTHFATWNLIAHQVAHVRHTEQSHLTARYRNATMTRCEVRWKPRRAKKQQARKTTSMKQKKRNAVSAVGKTSAKRASE